MLQDPLAALDRAHQPPPGVAAPDPQLTFPSTLGLGGAPKIEGQRAHAFVAAEGLAEGSGGAEGRTCAEAGRRHAPKPIAAAPKPIAAAKPAPAVAPPVDPAKAKGKYTLQLSTFTTSADADAFVQKYPGAFVIAADVPGKGMVYRVRLGNYGSYKDAVAAKDSFEKQHSTIALIAAR